MSAWRRDKLRRLMCSLGFFALLLIVVPPHGVCLRNMLTHANCCAADEQVTAVAEAKPCCAACAARQQQEKQSSAPLAPSEHGKLCFAAPACPFVVSAETKADVCKLVAVALIPAGQCTRFASASQARSCVSNLPPIAQADESPGRENCVLRI